MMATGGRVDHALDYVCLHMPHDELPMGFSDKVYPSADGGLSVAINTGGGGNHDGVDSGDGPSAQDRDSGGGGGGAENVLGNEMGRSGAVSGPSKEDRGEGVLDRSSEKASSCPSTDESILDAGVCPTAAEDRTSGVAPPTSGTSGAVMPVTGTVTTKTAGVSGASAASSKGPSGGQTCSSSAINSAWILKFAEGVSSSDDDDDDDGDNYGSSGRHEPLDAGAEYAAGLRRLASLVSDAAAAKACGDKALQRELGQQISRVKARNAELERSGDFNAEEVRALVARDQDDAKQNTTSADGHAEADGATAGTSTRVPLHGADSQGAQVDNADSPARAESDSVAALERVAAPMRADGRGSDMSGSEGSDLGDTFNVFDIEDDEESDDAADNPAASTGDGDDDSVVFPGLCTWPTRYVTPSWTGKTPRDLLGGCTQTLLYRWDVRSPSLY